MCSNYEDEYCEENESLKVDCEDMEERSISICKKCGEEQSCVLLRKKDAYCRLCFLTYVTQRFRATIGKAKALGHGDGVLVAFSGGRSSTALAHLVAKGLKQSEFKKLHVVPSLLYIDEGGVYKKTEQDRKDLRRKVWKHAQAYDMTLYVTAFENLRLLEPEVYEVKSDEDLEGIKWDQKESSEIAKLVDSTTSLTAKEDLILVLRRECLAQAALATNHKKVLLGDNATTLAVSTLTSVAAGRGDQLLDCVGFREVHGSGVEFLRCLRELDAREIAYYLQLNDQSPVNVTSVATKLPPGSSVHRLSESFILGLQDNLSSTVPTVVRTAAKLSQQNHVTSHCALCQRRHCSQEGRYTAAEATRFSERISLSASPDTRNQILSDSCSGKGGGGCRSCSGTSLKTCYGCSVLLKSMDAGSLPAHMLNRGKEAAKLLDLREQIEDFLLE